MTTAPDLSRRGLLASAVEAARRNWHVIPLRPRDKRPAGHATMYCPGTGRCTDGHRTPEERATTDHALLAAAWEQQPYNVGIATGPSGLLVVDLDTLKPTDPKGTPDGATAFAALCERAGQAAPDTYRVRTARGGEHLYFTQPPGIRLHSTAGRLAKKIDTRGWGGYVVAPGSTTPDGTYTVLDDREPVPLPEWLREPLTAAPSAVAGPLRLPVVAGSLAAQAALEAECAAVSGAADGTRNTVLNRSAFKVGRFVAWGDLPRHVVEEAFQAAGESAGLAAAECRSTIRSALDSSIRTARPREAA
ncbi:bifunctional DNA primase/polymerase [Streptomyces sp. MBT49]|uniref:bifunctional DNA primase/polymerase n=1 Tax=Streptomyces sp. MBT49 TaxID=1488380 RepID=UPI00190B6994|nr:bifunctional DNA primase/polymerase [Streptomyces sp. MBT49]MBK3626988.1 bifunctional DNA primase/polymerase [Streptomyces sp. MBT49]